MLPAISKITPAWFLKETADEVDVKLAMIFQASLHQDNIPGKWWKATMTPIFEGEYKDPSQAVNYKPTSLNSITCKVLEHNSQQHNFSFRSTKNIDICSTRSSKKKIKVNKLIISCWILVKHLTLFATKSFY